MDTKSAGVLGVCIVVGALILSLMPRSTSPSRTASDDAVSSMHRIHSAEASLVVDYMVETSPTSFEGGQMGGVTDIEFHENYIVVKDKSGHGRVFTGSRMKSFNWFESKR